MRLLVVGAGASLAECIACNVPEELHLPVISNFARKLWTDYSPAVLLSAFIASRRIAPDFDPRAQFFKLEEERHTEFNVELFFQFAWDLRDRFPGEWENLMAHGILGPLQFILLQSLWKNGPLKAPLTLYPAVAKQLQAGDIVLSLNYETLFEIGAIQAGHTLSFLPNRAPTSALRVAKPHGSINLVVERNLDRFAFGELNWSGNPQPANGSRNYLGFIPPRQSKSYAEHWIARAILSEIEEARPSVVTFWGIGFARSDVDLLALYKKWCDAAETIEVINPDPNVAKVVRETCGDKVTQFGSAESWLGAQGAA